MVETKDNKKVQVTEPFLILARIKKTLEKYFEDIGRDRVEDMEEHRMDCIDNIDDIIQEINIPSKYLIIEAIR